MKAYLINAETQSIETVEINNRDDIINLIGYDTLESDAIGNEGDRLFFDEECYLRGSAGRFQIDTIIPVSGIGVLVGSNEDASMLFDVMLDINTLRGRIKYL